MMKISVLYYLPIAAIWLCGCHVYVSGFIINNTKDTLMVTTKPSLLSFEKPYVWPKLSAENLAKDESVFSCQVLPFDTLAFNGGPSYSSSISLIDYLKIERKDKDSVIMNSNKAIRKNTVVFSRRFANRVKLGMKVTDSFFTNQSKK